MGFPLFSPFPLSLRQDLSSTYFLAFFYRPVLYYSHNFIALSAGMFLLSLILSYLLFLSEYIHLPSIINVPLICSGNVWRIFGHNCCIISLFFFYPLLTLHIPVTKLFSFIYRNIIWTNIIRLKNNILRIANFEY